MPWDDGFWASGHAMLAPDNRNGRKDAESLGATGCISCAFVLKSSLASNLWQVAARGGHGYMVNATAWEIQMKNQAGAMLLLLGLTLVGPRANALVSHGISNVLTIDTVSAVNDGVEIPPRTSCIAAVYPNPFNPRTVVEFEIAEPGLITLAIYDLGGRLVQSLGSGVWSAGRHRLIWDGKDRGGQTVPTGTYFCRLSSAQGTHTRKLMLAR